MTFTKQLLSMLALATIGLSACNDNSVSDNGYYTDRKIVASPLTVIGKLNSKRSVKINDSFVYKPIPWELGAGKLVAVFVGDDVVAETNVSEDGSFTMTLPSTLKYPFVNSFSDLRGGLTITPKYFLATQSPICSFYFYTPDDPSTPNWNESLYIKDIVSPKIINESDSTVLLRIGFTMAENGTVIGTSTNGEVKYNSKFKKGWNIETWKDVDGVTEYSVVNSMPANVVWF